MRHLCSYFRSRRRSATANISILRFEHLEPRLALTTVNDLGTFSTFNFEGGGPHAENSDGQVTLAGAVDYLNYVGGGQIDIAVSGTINGSYTLNVPTIFRGNGTAATMSVTFNSSSNNIQSVSGSVTLNGTFSAISQIYGTVRVNGDINTIVGISGASAGLFIDGDDNDASQVQGQIASSGDRNEFTNNTGSIVVTSGTNNEIHLNEGSITATVNDSDIFANSGGHIYVIGNQNTINVNDGSTSIRADGNENTVDENELAGGNQFIFVDGDDNEVTNNELDGSDGVGITIVGAINQVDHNIISNTANSGVAILGNDNTISNNQILASNWDGVFLNGSSTFNNHVILNRITGSKLDSGVSLFAGAHDNTIEHNVILNNNWAGVEILSAPNNIVIDNVIAGNKKDGISISGGTAVGTQVEHNWIGLDEAGSPLANRFNGISISNAGGGHTLTDNVVSANLRDGIVVLNTNGTHILDNYVGTDTEGNLQATTGNTSNGINLTNANDNILTGNTVSGNSNGIRVQGNNNLVGGARGSASNFVTDNRFSGVLVTGNANQIRGNYIGTDPQGADHGNDGQGVDVAGDNNVIGASKTELTATNMGNSIAFNAGNGVLVTGTGTGNTIRLNQIFKNDRLGIDLNSDYADRYGHPGRTTGANNLIYHPTIIANDNHYFTWMLNGAPNTHYTIDVYRDPDNGYLAYAEGKDQAHAPLSVTTDSTGHAEFTTMLSQMDRITATATDASGNTSEFSLADEDADGLCDTWETATGIDLDGNGTAELVLPGADRRRKDVYVEVDAMGTTQISYAPSQGSLDAVAKAFRHAPLRNPDDSYGVTLHAELSTIGITLGGPDPTALGEDYWAAFQGIKGAYFGPAGITPLQYQARLLAYRYCLFAGTREEPPTKSTGESEGHPSNDFVVTLGKLWQDYAVKLHADSQRGTFMHELGHTLGLSHAGPTAWGETLVGPLGLGYHSVMNYAYQFPGSKDANHESGEFRLDYSRTGLIDWITPTPVGGQPYRGMWFVYQESKGAQAGADAVEESEDVHEEPNGPTSTTAELVVAASGPAAPVAANEDFVLTFVAANVGDLPATGASLSATLPANLTIISAISDVGSASFNGQTVSANVGTLNSLDGAIVTVTVRATAGGIFEVMGQVATTAAGDVATNNASIAIVEVISDTLAGDYNQDDSVDAADYIIWRKTLGQTGVTPYSGADGDGDGTIDQDDYTVWRANFGSTLPSAGAGTGNGHTSSGGIQYLSAYSPAAVDIAVDYFGEPVVPIPTETISASAQTDATDESVVRFTVLETLGHSSSSRPRRAIHRYQLAESGGEDLLRLLAIDRVCRFPGHDSLADDSENAEHRDDDDVSENEIDEPLTPVIAIRRGARSFHTFSG